MKFPKLVNFEISESYQIANCGFRPSYPPAGAKEAEETLFCGSVVDTGSLPPARPEVLGRLLELN